MRDFKPYKNIQIAVDNWLHVIYSDTGSKCREPEKRSLYDSSEEYSEPWDILNLPTPNTDLEFYNVTHLDGKGNMVWIEFDVEDYNDFYNQ